MQRKLLVVLDGGPLDWQVVTDALELADERRAALRCVYVCPPAGVAGEVLPVAADMAVVLPDVGAPGPQVHSGEDTLARVTALAEELGLAVRTRVLCHADPAQEIVYQATSQGCEWILVAVHGDNLWQRLTGTSLNQQLLALSKVPVLFCTPIAGRLPRKRGMQSRMRRWESRERRERERND